MSCSSRGSGPALHTQLTQARGSTQPAQIRWDHPPCSQRHGSSTMTRHCHSPGQARVLRAPAVTSPGDGAAETARALPWTQGSHFSFLLKHPANWGCAVLSWQLPWVLEQEKLFSRLLFSVPEHPPTLQRRSLLGVVAFGPSHLLQDCLLSGGRKSWNLALLESSHCPLQKRIIPYSLHTSPCHSD